MTAPDSLPFAALLEENLASASPDLLRQMVKTFADAMMSADVDNACGASYGMPSEQRVACVFDTAPAPRRPHDIVHPPGGRSESRPPRPGPKAERKWCTASVIRPPEQVITDAFDQAQARDPQHLRDWIVLVDGARHQLDLIQDEASRRDIRLHVLLDFVHVPEYCWTAAHAFHPVGSREAETWAADKLTAILAGHADRAAAEMTVQAAAERLPATRRAAVTTCHRYLTGHLDQLHYDTALAAGWPIATGAVEGACRHLIADRLDITGARWGLDGAEAVLRLRALITNGDFEDYWIFHTAREHQRLYPTSRTTASPLDPDRHFRGSAPYSFWQPLPSEPPSGFIWFTVHRHISGRKVVGGLLGDRTGDPRDLRGRGEGSAPAGRVLHPTTLTRGPVLFRRAL
ncbi:ISKra4 family transposase [Streptomyces sp. NPDC005262]|uniref:ISKra4 family transposase n=1 Tax=Streptomyces sp. NPDC005262 TaxID=3364710 RepID=UPI0036B6CBB4